MPFYASKFPILSTPLADSLLHSFQPSASPTSMPTPRVHLYTAVSGPLSPTTPVSAFTEATFSGYSSVPITVLLGPVNLPAGGGVGVHQEADFLAGAVVSPGQNVLGYWVDDGGSNVYVVESFSTPIPMVNPGDFISLDVIFPIQYQVQTT